MDRIKITVTVNVENAEDGEVALDRIRFTLDRTKIRYNLEYEDVPAAPEWKTRFIDVTNISEEW